MGLWSSVSIRRTIFDGGIFKTPAIPNTIRIVGAVDATFDQVDVGAVEPAFEGQPFLIDFLALPDFQLSWLRPG